MANTVIALKKSAVPSQIPSDLANGEIAINYADGKLYYKNTAGYVAELKTSDLGNYFGSVNADGTFIVADTTSDVFSLVAGDNVTIVGDALNDTITISASVPGGGDPSFAFRTANAAFDTANAAFSYANTISSDADEKANAAIITANVAFDTANLAFDKANSANYYAYLIDANTKAAFDAANNVTPQITPAFTTANAAYDKANSANILAYQVGGAVDGINVTVAYANSAWDQANSANYYAFLIDANTKAAFDAANNVAPQITPAFTTANLSFDKGNAAHLTANAAFDVSNAAFNYANTISSDADEKANAAIITANVAYDKGNAAHLTANAAFNIANNAFANVANNVFAGSLGIGNTVFNIGNGGQTELTLGSPSFPARFTIWDSSSGRTTYEAIMGGGYRFQGASSDGGLKNDFLVFPGAATYLRSYATDITFETTTGSGYSGVTGVTYRSDGNIVFKVLDTETYRITNTGNIAVGRISANYKFDIVGTINTSNILINQIPLSTSFLSANAYADTKLANTSGITFDGDLNFSGNATANNIAVSNYLDIKPRANAAYKEGRLYYSSEEKTFVGYGDYTDFEQTLGEREWVRCKNSNAYTLYKGNTVYVTGVHISGHPIHGHHPTIDLADSSDITKKDVIGLVGADIAPGEHGYVVTRGYIEGLNTSSLTSGTRVHLGFNGGVVNDAPEYPNWPMDIGICLTSNNTNGTIYVYLSDHSMERLRVQNSARIGGDLTVEGDLSVLGAENRVTVNSLEVGTQFVYLGSGDSIPLANINFTGSGLNDLEFRGHYIGSSCTTFYVMISDSTPDKFSWGYNSDFTNLVQSNVVMQYQTSQLLSNGISVYFNANTGHTIGDKWNATAFGISTDFGFVGNHIDGPNGYTHAGLFRDATDGTYKFFRSYDPEPTGNIDIGNTTFNLANVQVFKIDAEKVVGTEVYEGATKLSDTITTAQNKGAAAHLTANSAYNKANVIVKISSTQPSNNLNGDLWWNSDLGRLLVYYEDVDSVQWVDATPVGDVGPTGNAGNVQIGTTSLGAPLSSATITNSGNGSFAILNFTIPRPSNVISNNVISVAPSQSPNVNNFYFANNDFGLDFYLPRAANVIVGDVVTGAPGSIVIVSPTTESNGDVTLDFTIPRGNDSVSIEEDAEALTRYVLFTDASSGTLARANVNSSTLTFIPSNSRLELAGTLNVANILVNNKSIFSSSIKTVDTNYSVDVNDSVILTSNTLTLTMPNALSSVGLSYEIKNINIGQVTIIGSDSDLIDGYANLIIQFKNSALSLRSIGTSWIIH